MEGVYGVSAECRQCVIVEGPRESITEMERAIVQMKSEKGGGPTQLVGEINHVAG